jgi:amidase/aspartyl-tRNA(Asn)/glutamyl-tRNA(Gln) amidotransferase subunit A
VTDLSSERTRELAATVGLTFGPQEAEEHAAALNDGAAGYDRLKELSTPRGHDDPARGVVFAPSQADDPLNAFTSLFDPFPAEGPLSDLELAVKDNMAVAGVPMTCGSRVFESAVPARHATVVRRLLEAGARLVGKTNMDELAYGPTSETSGYGPVRNPADREHVAGGSSSGSAAAVADGRIDAAIGSDTGGSVRIPASFCGVVGFKPTWGAIPRTGMVELSYTLDHVGPMARDVRTTARVFDAISGPDPKDPSSERAARLEGSAVEAVDDPPDIGDLSFGLPAELFADHVDDAVASCVRYVVDAVEAAGASVTEVSIPAIDYSVDVWNTITNTEFAATLRADLVPVRRRVAVDPTWHDAAASAMASHAEEFGTVVRRKATTGAKLLDEGAGAYVRARTVAKLIADQFATATADHDALLAPTMPVTAPKIGRWSADSYSAETADYDVPLAYNTRSADLAGVPAVTLPCDRIDGLPVGFQLLGEEYADNVLFGIARAIERHLGVDR